MSQGINSMSQLRQFLLREVEWCLEHPKDHPFQRGYLSCLFILQELTGIKQPERKANERKAR